MLFHSFDFFLLLFITAVVYYSVPRLRLWCLAAADVIFYGASGAGYLILFFFAAVFTYLCSLQFKKKRGNVFFAAALFINISNLIFFKYSGFLLTNFEKILGIPLINTNAIIKNIILPIGISFYTFQLIAYAVDVKRRDIEACKSFLKFWVFISFYAQLIAGPIMRGKDFLPQIDNVLHIRVSINNIKLGAFYIIKGLIKKLMLADIIAPRVNYYYSQIALINTLDAWFAAYLFAFQIYFDFSAYSDIAVGIGHLLGFRLDRNFKTPYLAGNSAEFWRSWHITLSSWIRDYIYIPLGGSKKGNALSYLFILIAMTASGLWHGAAWTFVLWGVYHGLLCIMHKVYTRGLKKLRNHLVESRLYKVVCIFAFFNLISIGLVVFRAATVNDAMLMIKAMFNASNVYYSPLYVLYFTFIAFLYLLHIVEWVMENKREKITNAWQYYIPPSIRAAVYVLLAIAIVLFTKTEQSSFIYFQF